MSDNRNFWRVDEQDVDFNDTRAFVFKRWSDAVLAVNDDLSREDVEKIREAKDWHTLYANLRKDASSLAPSSKRQMNPLYPLPRTLADLASNFTAAVQPYEPDFSALWGLVGLNLKLSYVSADKLARTSSWMKKLRSVIELFNRCFEGCEDLNEARYSMVDVLENLVLMLTESAKYLRECPTDAEATKSWGGLQTKINEYHVEIEAATKQLNDIIKHSMAAREIEVRNLSLRNVPAISRDEYATFPISMIPRKQNENFYGRQEELDRINRYLDVRGSTGICTYTIYGRRGVGKTNIALQYAYTNPSGFEAIFWVQCETSLSLRQSYTDMAVALNLPGADRHGHHEENQLAVLRWLNKTKRRWLLIFDNAERESIMKGYWPLAANGAILITSRKYYNFVNDAHRKGDTIKPFDGQQSWDLFVQLLGPDWQDLDKKGLIKTSEEHAAKKFLEQLGGLALAIQLAAQLVKDPKFGGNTIQAAYKSFMENKESLPARVKGDRSDTIHSLDSLWNMAFNFLSRNARDLLSVLSLLSPDGILIDLFLPRNQKVLDGKLAFCKQHANHIDPDSQAALSSVITPPPPLRAAIEELSKLTLVKQEGRELWAHREVQEAMNYHSTQDLQDYFNSASALVHEAFPKLTNNNPPSAQQWRACEAYIIHGTHLGLQYHRYAALRKISNTMPLKGSQDFIELLSNCAWYLIHVSDFDLCLEVADIGSMACHDKESMQYAELCNLSYTGLFELNKLGECRRHLETYLHLQEKLLPESDFNRSWSYHNMGNLESASENYEEAAHFLNKAINIRIRAGDSAAFPLAISYLCLARLHYLRREFDTAFDVLAKSEALFDRTAGADAHFMAHVHYLYGNIEFEQQRFITARRSYESCLKIGLASAPIHPITTAAYYSLGCVEYEKKNMDNARAWLDKAMAIAQLRSPKRVDGTMARILWKTSVVLASDPFGTYQKEADDMNLRAEMARRDLTGNGEGAIVIALDDEGNVDAAETEESYDVLVPAFFR